VAILDVNMPSKDGIDVVMELLTKNVSTRVILLTMHREMSLYQRATELNVWGYVLKDRAEQELQTCIETVLNGQRFVSPGLMSDLLPDQQQNDSLLSKLTVTERKVIELVAQQKTTKQIAELLFISDKTVEGHRSHIIEKLELPKVKNALLVWALSNVRASGPEDF
jgi:two-component system nitrate/nitrite response regulator NarL